MAANKRVYSLKEVGEQFQDIPDDDFADSGDDIDADLSDDEHLPIFLTEVRSNVSASNVSVLEDVDNDNDNSRALQDVANDEREENETN